MGQYTQVDPIGLAGGNPTLYGYVFNPYTNIDPLGLLNIREANSYEGKGYFQESTGGKQQTQAICI